jgi:hypothetical protein
MDAFTQKGIEIEIQDTSKNAIRRVEELGGKIKTVWYHEDDLEFLLHPNRFIIKTSSLLLPKTKALIGFK